MGNHFEGQHGQPFQPELTQGHQHVTIGAAAFIPYRPPNTRAIMMQAIAKNVRYTLDNSAPSATVGFALVAGDDPTVLELTNDMVIRFYGEDAAAVIEYCWGV